MNHYDTLGVTSNATPEDIKRGYRKASSAAHPDKGGSDDQMARVNAAYDVLSDTERRKRYDETGEDGKIETLDCAARELLLQVLDQTIAQEGDPIARARAVIAKNLEKTAHDKHVAERKISRLESRRPLVSAKEGPNLYHGLIDQQLDTLRQQIPQMEHFAKVLSRAAEMLDLHEYHAPSVDTPTAIPRKPASLYFVREESFGTEPL